jgi:hypothetical protein
MTGVLHLALDVLDGEVERHLLLALLAHRHLERGQRVWYRVHGAHNVLDGKEAPGYVGHGDVVTRGALTRASSTGSTHGGA